ncbi:DUF2312 domain-containing protein [Sinorhizobium meliloti]|uniref:DUF2312 domain-containing protein n=2 Tax=Rhizobium meliloti TaxID=382 RepID=UPI000FD3D298|nr:GapR family DNA-binding domain-containing protein [Sinorhizobium meliloti]MDW9415181.1 DUF2312 domain-containing protein [Sinorhizobium meliloti]MDW9509959.1 DUF2312 domain-containing protein [Sinorhizobium meliloti]MDW9905114.1 DUF2312 domain-containing protein [Sinorhizobium meliloti]MDX0022884.1 DUF2312 domain-containing protein [Sinorhizobium meliloti]MDX0123885.1 DUF2312 domain-containing protein [Sinorhizobium meliloti]
MTSDAQIRAFIDRILRLKEEQDTIGEDIRDIYAEAKSMGFDKTAMGNVVAHLRKVAKKGHDTVAEQGAIFDLYLCAYEGKSPHAPAPARVRENIEQFDPTTGEIIEADISAKLVETIAAGVQTEVGRAALIAAVDIMIEREEQEIATSAGGESEEVAKNAVASASGPDEKRASNSPEEATEMDRDVLRGDEIAHAVPAENARKAVPETEDGSVSHAGAGESPAANSIGKPKYVLRPHCLNPGETCGGYSDKHCHACTVAMRKREQAEEVA